MGVDRAACLVREPIFLYLSDGKFKCQCNGFFFFFLNILVIAQTVIQKCHLYSAFLICSVPQRCCQADLSKDLAKMGLSRAACSSLTSVSQPLPRAHVPGV